MSEKLFLEMRKMIASQLSKDENEVTLESSFRNDLGADSLDLIEMIMSLEESFNIEISEDEAEGIETVKDAVQFVVKHLG